MYFSVKICSNHLVHFKQIHSFLLLIYLIFYIIWWYYDLSLTEGSSLGSLQRVKEILRRLRWQQERTGGKTLPSSRPSDQPKTPFVIQIASDICKFVCGEPPYNAQSRSDQDLVPCWKMEPREMVEALSFQQSKAEVLLYFISIHIDKVLVTGWKMNPRDDCHFSSQRLRYCYKLCGGSGWTVDREIPVQFLAYPHHMWALRW